MATTATEQTKLTGAYVGAWAERAAATLAHHRAEINELNVFPIPDSDTGSNMTATMESAVDRMHRDHGRAGSSAVAGTRVADITASLAAGAVAGARGNSGLVLSQLLRALADTAAARSGDLPVSAIPAILHRAEKLVRQAVSDPVEGTIITVLHAAALRAEEQVDRPDAPLREVVSAARDAAAAALEETTEQLPALAAAGVVDAGGRGLVVILEALVDALEDPEDDGAGGTDGAGDPDGSRGSGSSGGSDDSGEGRSATVEIEVMFTYRAGTEALDALREQLNLRGNSVVVVPGENDGSWRVHVHTLEAGPLIELAYRTGEVSDLLLEALPEVEDSAAEQRPTAPVLALTPEGGLREIFAGAGASAGDTDMVVREFERRGTGCIVLTNGQDTAELFGLLSSSSGAATVVDTESFVGGLAALAVYSPTSDLDDNAEEMADAVSAQRWRETDGGVAELRQLVDDLLDDGGELVTVLYDESMDADEVTAVIKDLGSDNPEVELHGYRVPGLGISVQVGVE